MPGRRATATSNTVARVNQSAIINALRKSGELTRPDLCSLTGLSPATVNRLTASMMREGVIGVTDHIRVTGGRPAILLRYIGGSRVVAAVQLRADHAIGALVSLDGAIVFTKRIELDTDIHPRRRKRRTESAPPTFPPSAESVAKLFEELLEVARSNGTPCAAGCVAVPGVVRSSDGTVSYAPDLDWHDVPLRHLLEPRLAIPIVVENDANALAFGELKRGVGVGARNLVAITLGNGFGAGIIANGDLYRGSRGEAGEVGYLLLSERSLKTPYPSFGDLESRIGFIGLTKAARSMGIQVPTDGLITVQDLLDLARQGDSRAASITDLVFDIVAIGVVAITKMLDPELIVFGEELARSAAEIISEVRRRVDQPNISLPRMEAASTAEFGVLLGSAELAAEGVRKLTYIRD